MSTGIEWTDDTWNPVTGCDEVSAGCDHCYAKVMYERFNGKGTFNTVKLHSARLGIPQRWRKPRMVFVNSMSDLFHKDVPDFFISEIYAVMSLTPRHTFQILTKRHGRMRSLLNNVGFRDQVDAARRARGYEPLPGSGPVVLPNVWLGVSVENQHWAGIRIPALLDTPAAVRWLSCEPLLGPIDLADWTQHAPWLQTEYGTSCTCGAAIVGPNDQCNGRHIDWVVAGGESGHGARPMRMDWARSLRDQCQAAAVPFLLKQWGDASLWVDKQGDVWGLGADELMHTPETAPFPREHVERKWGPLKRLSKKTAGRELDGRVWDEYPETVSA